MSMYFSTSGSSSFFLFYLIPLKVFFPFCLVLFIVSTHLDLSCLALRLALHLAPRTAPQYTSSNHDSSCLSSQLVWPCVSPRLVSSYSSLSLALLVFLCLTFCLASSYFSYYWSSCLFLILVLVHVFLLDMNLRVTSSCQAESH